MVSGLFSFILGCCVARIKIVEYVENPISIKTKQVRIVESWLCCFHIAYAIAAKTTKPVIGVPADNGPLEGIDALLSTVQMPKGIPVSTVAIGSTGATNAGYLAAQILSLGSEEIAKKLKSSREKNMQSVLEVNQKLSKK